MAKKKSDKLVKEKGDLNKLSQLMQDQNESLRKLLKELSTKENEINRRNKNTEPYQFIDLNKKR